MLERSRVLRGEGRSEQRALADPPATTLLLLLLRMRADDAHQLETKQESASKLGVSKKQVIYKNV